MNVIELLQIVIALLVLAGCAYWLIAIFIIGRFFGSPETVPVSNPEPVTVLKPVKGTDPGLEENLKSFCIQDYPAYEMLLGFNNAEPTELENAERAVNSVYCRKIRIITSEAEIGANQKVSNLQGMIDEARNELLVLSDSDMRVDRNYLGSIVNEYHGAEGIGMVTCLYKISDPENAGAAFESMSIALDFLPSVLVAEKFEGVSFGLGASMIFSKKTLGEIGGFSAVADYIADDYQIGNRIAKMGLKIVLSKYVVENVAGPMSFREHFRHQLRWARTVRVCRPAGYFGSGISHVIPFAAILAMMRGIDVVSISALGMALALRYGVAAQVYSKVIRKCSWLKWLALLPLKDITAFLVWIGAFVGSRVWWRGSAYEIMGDGKIRNILADKGQRKA